MKESEIRNSKSEICLSIAGLDPSGGAGVIADVKTFTAFGCFATAAVTSLTFQNTTGVFGAAHQTAETVRGQIEPVLDDFEVSAVKTGMLPTREIIEEIAEMARERQLKNLVVDPVVRSTSGFDLIDDAALGSLIENLFPLAEIITPNIPEAERITGMKITNEDEIKKAAARMHILGAKAIIIKGGHLPIVDSTFRSLDLEKYEIEKSKIQQRRLARDFLFVGGEAFVFSTDFIETNTTHGTGCTFAAAIAANLAKGKNLYQAVETAKKFVTEAIRTAPNIGGGHSPVNHSISGFK